MDIKPLVSVIIPCYNVKNYVTETLDSLAKQTYENIEVIIIDDASDDNTLEVLQTYNALHDIKIIAQKINKGVSVSRNIGISIAKGKYITFLDADDRYEPEFIERGVFALESSGAGVYSCAFEKIGLKRKSYTANKNISSKFIISGPDFLEHLFTKKIYQHICAMIINVSLVHENNLRFDGQLSYSEDLLFITKLFLHTKTVHYSDVEYFKYNIRGGSAMSSTFKRKRMDTLLALNEIEVLLSESKYINSERIRSVFSVYSGITKIYLLKLALKAKTSKEIIYSIYKHRMPKIKLRSVFDYNLRFMLIALISFLIEASSNVRKK